MDIMYSNSLGNERLKETIASINEKEVYLGKSANHLSNVCKSLTNTEDAYPVRGKVL